MSNTSRASLWAEENKALRRRVTVAPKAQSTSDPSVASKGSSAPTPPKAVASRPRLGKVKQRVKTTLRPVARRVSPRIKKLRRLIWRARNAGMRRVLQKLKKLVRARLSKVVPQWAKKPAPASVVAKTPQKTQPTKQPTLATELNRQWYQLGSITGLMAAAQSGDVSKLSPNMKNLVERAAGDARLLEKGVQIPPRVAEPVYRPEPSRVLYAAHSTPAFNSNGYSTRTRGIVDGIQESGRDVVVVARSGYPWDSAADVAKPRMHRYEQLVDGVPYVHNPGGNINRDPFDRYLLKAADTFVREAKMLRPALIHSASNFRTALPALIAARRVGVPFVYEVRGLWEITELVNRPHLEDTERFNQMRDLETLVAKEADKVLVITQQVREELIRRGVPAEKIEIVPNAVDPDVFVPLVKDVAYAKQRKLDPEIPTIGFAGSMVAYEGLDTLLEASALLAEQGVPHQVAIAGSGAAEKALKEQAKELGLNTVKFLGRLPQDEMPRLMSVFDIVVAPRHSRQITELVSALKPLESFSAAKATVLSSVRPNLDLAGDNQERARLFTPGDAAELAEVLKELLESPDARRQLGQEARLWTLRERNWHALGETVAQHYEAAEAEHQRLAVPSRELQSLTVGLIADEFTTTTLSDSFNTVVLSRAQWREQFAEHDFDLIVVESAWKGINGDWHRGVGHYSDEESADLRELLTVAQGAGVPTAFWNKEDPVHFARFAANAALFDHVFTTDANMVEKYLALPDNRIKTASAMPFYAQPKIHNPLWSGEDFRATIAHAGTYYGDRYKERSRSLDALLAAAEPYGIDIFDRQADIEGSPYHFPPQFHQYVRGALPYAKVIDSYKSHIAHLNVNSVTDSPTMFSRRVAEIPACGGLVLSSAGRGIAETIGQAIPATEEPELQRAFLQEWATNPEGSLREHWLQMRAIYRAHTTATALAVLCRTVGIPAAGLRVPSVAVVLPDATSTQRELLAAQSFPPAEVLDNATGATADLIVECDPHWFSSRTFLEDVTLPFAFGQWNAIALATQQWEIGQPLMSVADDEAIVVARQRMSTGVEATLMIHLPKPQQESESPGATETESQPVSLAGKTIVVAGHDLKFAGDILAHFEESGAKVIVDQWQSHTKHDEAHSEECLAQADIVFCEWGLGNAVWYSKHVRPEQHLVVRVHSQELFLPYLKQIAKDQVDSFIFVGELIRRSAIVSHGVPAEKTVVIPNGVRCDELALEKKDNARFVIGFVGMVPRSKRLDKALDVIERLVEQDSRYQLRIKGKTPQDYPWMLNRKDEMAFYDEQYARIERLNAKHPDAVRFDGFGPDMAEWYSEVGIVLSVSDFESFHLTLADGAASEALPTSLAWPGSDLIYPHEWLDSSVDGIVQRILAWDGEVDEYRQFVAERFDVKKVTEDVSMVTR